MKQNLQENIVEQLPWFCLQHPNAEILHTWDRSVTIGWNDGYPRGQHDHNHKYECKKCGLELAAPNSQKGNGV